MIQRVLYRVGFSKPLVVAPRSPGASPLEKLSGLFKKANIDDKRPEPPLAVAIPDAPRANNLSKGPWPEDSPKRGRAKVSIKPMMDDASMELYYWLSDELEMASPNLTIHAGVSASALLHMGATLPSNLPDSLRHAALSLVILDETALPLAAILFDDENAEPAFIEALATLLERAELPALVVDPAEEPALVWKELRALISYEIAA